MRRSFPYVSFGGEASILLLEDRDGQPGATLAAAVREDLRAALARHASEETMRAEAALVVGLECALGLCHDSDLVGPCRTRRGRSRAAKTTTADGSCQGPDLTGQEPRSSVRSRTK